MKMQNVNTGFRELTVEEIDVVAGGIDDIVVVGPKRVAEDGGSFGGFGGWGGTSYFGGFGGFGGGGGGGGGQDAQLLGGGTLWGDDDGDGIPNFEDPEPNVDNTVVVNGPSAQDLGGNFYGYQLSNGTMIIKYDGWFSNSYVGDFKPGTPENHNFVTSNDTGQYSLGYKGVEGSYTSTPNSRQYWTRVAIQ